MDVIRGTRSLAQSLKLPWPFKKNLGENPEQVSRRKSNVLFFGIEMLAHTFNEYVLVKSARILLASFFISLRFF